MCFTRLPISVIANESRGKPVHSCAILAGEVLVSQCIAVMVAWSGWTLYRGFIVKTRFLPIRTLHLSIRTLHHLAKAWFVYIVFFLFIFLILPSSLWLHPSYVICTWYYVCTWDNVEHREGQPDLNSHVVGRWPAKSFFPGNKESWGRRFSFHWPDGKWFRTPNPLSYWLSELKVNE